MSLRVVTIDDEVEVFETNKDLVTFTFQPGKDTKFETYKMNFSKSMMNPFPIFEVIFKRNTFFEIENYLPF